MQRESGEGNAFVGVSRKPGCPEYGNSKNFPLKIGRKFVMLWNVSTYIGDTVMYIKKQKAAMFFAAQKQLLSGSYTIK